MAHGPLFTRTTVNVKNNVLKAIGYVNTGLCGLELHAHDKGLVDLNFRVNLVLEKEVPWLWVVAFSNLVR